MKKIFFVSDIHFGLHDRKREREKEDRFLAFLEHVEKEGERLFIVGDLFDYWFEYKHVIPRGYHHLLSRLGMMVRRGIVIDYIAGNHDYWLKDFFPDELGITVHRDPVDIAIGELRIYLHHGDGLAHRDTGYKILKRVLRNRWNIRLFTFLHPDLAAGVAKFSSRKSRQYTANKDYGERDGMICLAENKISQGFDFVVMGHRHRPLQRQIGKGMYVNLGDWVTHNTYAEIFNGTISLKTWTL